MISFNMEKKKLLMATLFATFLSGCTTLPDVSGYTSSSTKLKNGYVVMNQSVLTSWNNVISAIPREKRDDYVLQRNEYASASADISKSLEALVNYAESVEEMVSAGSDGAEAAKKVAGSAKSLLDNVSLIPGAATISAALGDGTDLISFVYGEIAKARATNKLEESLKILGPALEQTSILLIAVVNDTNLLALNLENAEKYGLDQQYGNEIQYLDSLNTKVSGLQYAYYDFLLEYVEALKVGAELNDAQVKLADKKHTKNALLESRWAINELQTELTPYYDKVAQLQVRISNRSQLVTSLSLALTEWANAHRKLVKAVSERKHVSFESLYTAASQLHEIINRMNKS